MESPSARHWFEHGVQDRQEIAVDEMKIDGDGKEVYVWAAVDRGTPRVGIPEGTVVRSFRD